MTATSKTPDIRAPFYFICVFWGERYWREFCRLCLASMLAPGNIPSLEDGIRASSRFVIVTTRADWEALQDDPTFILMKRHIEPMFIELPRPGADENKMSAMSRGHALASEAAFRARACGVYLTPDLVLSDGSVVALQRLSRAGRKVVLCVAVRFTEEGCLPELEALGVMEPGAPMVLPARTLVGVALRNIHSETRRYEWDSPYFAEVPISPYWRVSGEEGIVMHSFSWAPLLVDYSALAEHDASTFEEWTLDGDYVHRNFGDHGDEAIHVVTDSDEITLVSFTREADLHFDLTAQWWKSWRYVGPSMKLSYLWALYGSAVMDDLKRRIFDRAVRLHGADLSPRWDETESRAAAIIAAATIDPPRFSERLVYKTVYRLIGLWAIRRGLYGTLRGTPNYPDAPFAWNTFMQGFVLPYTRLLFASRFHRTTARAVSLYVRVRSYLTVGYMRHLHQKFRGYMIGRKQRFISLRINAQARGRLLVQRLSARRG